MRLNGRSAMVQDVIVSPHRLCRSSAIAPPRHRPAYGTTPVPPIICLTRLALVSTWLKSGASWPSRNRAGSTLEAQCAWCGGATVGGTCCVLYAVRMMVPRGHYAETTTRCTTKGPAAGEGGRAQRLEWCMQRRSSSDGEREKHTHANGVVQNEYCYQLYTRFRVCICVSGIPIAPSSSSRPCRLLRLYSPSHSPLLPAPE